MAPIDESPLRPEEQPTPLAAEELCAEPEVVEQSIQEALHCATTLAASNEADEAVELLRCSCQQAPAASLAAAYQAVVESYLRMDRSEAAFSLLAELQQQGRCVVPSACQEVVLRVLVQTQQHARAAELLRFMCGAGAAPGDAVFNSVVDATVRARAYGEAWDVLELLLTNQRRADKYFVSILTKSLESSNDRKWVRRGINLVDRFIEQQKEDVDEIVFNSLLNVLGHVGDMLKLQQTLNKMLEYNVQPSAVTYGTVVKAYGRARDIDAVLKVWNDMRSRCLGVNPVTCGCVLDACVKCGHLDKAMRIFQEMKLSGLHKNTVLYATLIKGLAKVRDLVGAIHLYQEMRVEGVPCNLVTFNSLMDVCVRCANLPSAAMFLQDMIAMGIQPDLITFSTLIKGYAHTGEVHKALALSKELKSRGLKCDEIMYNSLIDGCAKANKLQEGLMVFEDMLQSRVIPSNITFSILVKLHFEAGQIAEAFRLVDDMAGRYRCVPSRIVYTVLLRCCSQQGGQALARGAALLTELASKRNSKLPDQGMVGAVIAGCVQHLEFDLASRVVHDFAAGANAKRGSSGLVTLDALRSLLEALGAHDEPRGQELLEFMRRRSLPTSHIAQLQAALSEGRRHGASGQHVGGNVGNVGNVETAVGGQQHTDAYSQWNQAPAYGAQAYGTEYYQQYNCYQQQNVYYQPQMAQMGQMAPMNHMGQMSQTGYYETYQQPQMLAPFQQAQMSTYPTMATSMQQLPQQLPSMAMPAVMASMQAAPVQQPVVSEFLLAPAANMQAPAPPPMAAPTPIVTAALAPFVDPVVAMPAPTTATQTKANRRASSKENNKENSGQPAQRPKGTMKELHTSFIEAAKECQAI